MHTGKGTNSKTDLYRGLNHNIMGSHDTETLETNSGHVVSTCSWTTADTSPKLSSAETRLQGPVVGTAWLIDPSTHVPLGEGSPAPWDGREGPEVLLPSRFSLPRALRFGGRCCVV